jgi:hypothetical protein
MSTCSGFSSRTRSDESSSRRLFLLREKVDLDAAALLDGSRQMELLRQNMSVHGDGTYKRLLDTIGIARALGGYLPVRYFMRETQEGFGRMKCEVFVEGITATPYVHMKREVRAHLARKYYWDVDMVNCQPSLLRQKLGKCGIECPLLDKYVSTRDACLHEVTTSCGVTRDQAKNLFIRLVYFGSIDAWLAETKTAESQIPPWILELQLEMRRTACTLLELPEFDDIRQYYSRRRLAVIDDDDDAAVPDSNFSNSEGSILALYLQTLECECVRALVEVATADARNVGGIIYDGIHVEKLDGERFLPKDLISRWQASVKVFPT